MAALGRGLDISLAALRRHDPYIQSIVDVASQVALYTFSHRANEWEKTDVEGTLFVYSRSASPMHGFTIMNRLSMENRTEPITKDLDFQLQDPFLLYRNARFCIYGIWFYNKEECQRIAELMKNLTQQEQLKAQQAANVEASPMVLHLDGKEVDILQMLNKARDEYTKCKSCSEPKLITSSSAIYSNPNLIKPIAMKPSDTSQHVTSIQSSKTGDTEPQHLSLKTLFGKPENPSTEDTEHRDSTKGRIGVVRSLSYEDSSRLSDSGEKQLCPAIQKLMERGADLHPVSEIPENQHSHCCSIPLPGDVFSSLFLPLEDVAAVPTPEPDGGQNLLHKLAGAHSAPLCPELGFTVSSHYSGMLGSTPGRTMGSAPHNSYDQSQKNQQNPSNIPTAPLSSQLPLPSGAISPQELLKKLNLVHQNQQFQASAKPTLAAKFPLVSQTALKSNWGEKMALGEKHNPLLQVISPQRIPATVSPSLLLSPLVFSQGSSQKTADVVKPTFSITDTKSNLLLPMSLTDTPTANISSTSSSLSKSQLRETLIHLIQQGEEKRVGPMENSRHTEVVLWCPLSAERALVCRQSGREGEPPMSSTASYR
ncbi:mRNA-decapping enzyme 1B isoform X2 [Hyperolius riggenbachi]|uniref:mRNA-decapping enzyme 1B isoform X2 n=1 Tax=Hyperolius riggenbachi TaxID=752182 RepID=UPI0035A29FE7